MLLCLLTLLKFVLSNPAIWDANIAHLSFTSTQPNPKLLNQQREMAVSKAHKGKGSIISLSSTSPLRAPTS
uniref:Uncharacterized protein n=1 Tax=Ditylenchus dipsaci TaxID=166011 RepID=A0A915CZY6_9BILA